MSPQQGSFYPWPGPSCPCPDSWRAISRWCGSKQKNKQDPWANPASLILLKRVVAIWKMHHLIKSWGKEKHGNYEPRKLSSTLTIQNLICSKQWFKPLALGFSIRHRRQNLADFHQLRKMYTISKCTKWKVISMYNIKELPACWEIEEIPKAWVWHHQAGPLSIVHQQLVHILLSIPTHPSFPIDLTHLSQTHMFLTPLFFD